MENCGKVPQKERLKSTKELGHFNSHIKLGGKNQPNLRKRPHILLAGASYSHSDAQLSDSDDSPTILFAMKLLRHTLEDEKKNIFLRFKQNWRKDNLTSNYIHRIINLINSLSNKHNKGLEYELLWSLIC